MKPWERAHMTAVGYGLILCLLALPIVTAYLLYTAVVEQIESTWPDSARTIYLTWIKKPAARGGEGGGVIGVNGGGGGAGMSMIYNVNPLTERAQDEEAKHRRKLNEPRPCMIGRIMTLC